MGPDWYPIALVVAAVLCAWQAIGGYFHLHVADETEATAIAQQCPGLEYGCVVEVRPLAERCTGRARAF